MKSWKALFANWPEGVSPRGVLVTTFNEQIPFSGFMTGEAGLVLDRQTPDSLGARTVIMPYDRIAALKFVDVVKPKSLRAMGFDPPGSTP